MPTPIPVTKRGEARRGGRPPREHAETITDDILDHAQSLFFTEGYGATSIEAIAQNAGMAKRTLYARFADKPALFRAVIHRVVEKLKPPAGMAELFAGANAEEVLRRIAPLVLRAALSPAALALHRLLVAEAVRFPELAEVANAENTRGDAIRRIAELLRRDPRGAGLSEDAARFAAEQFMQMVVATPQRRALGLGQPLSPRAMERWAQEAVTLFLNGCYG